MFTHLSKKAIAVFLLFSFLGSETARANPEFASPLRFSPEKPQAFHLDIPSSLGKVEEFYLPPGEKDFPFVVHIQAIHAHYETARKIREMIRHVEKNYGVNQILAEGASEKLHPEYLNFVPDPKLNQKIINALAEKGELTGVDYALPNSSLEAWGIEEPGLYRRALGIFKKVIGGREQAEALLNGKRLALDREASRFFDKDLRELVSCWLKFNAAQKGMLEVFRFLRGQAKAELDIDFENAFSQYDWPQLTRLALLQELEKRESAAEFKKEKEKLAAWLKTLNISEDFTAYLEAAGAADPEDSPAEDSPRKRAEAFLEKTVPHGFRFSDYPQITYRAASKVLQSEMQSKALFEEFDRLFNRLLALRAEKPEEQKFVEEYRVLVFLEKLFRLELTPDDWEKVKQKGIGKEEATGRQAIRFYRLMEKRDAVFQARIQKQLSGTSRKAVLVTGGFHAKGLKAFFEKNRIGYALITPQISGPIDSSLYYQIMTRTSNLEQTLFTQDPGVSLKKQGWDVAAQRESVLQVHRQQKIEADASAPYFAAVAASLGAEPLPAEESLLDYQYDPQLGRDQKVFLVVKNFRQQAFTMGQIMGKRSGIMGGSDVRKYVPGLVGEIDLSADRIENSDFDTNGPVTEPMGIDRHGKLLAVTAGDRVLVYDFKRQITLEYTYPWFASLHTVQFSPDGKRLLVSSTGFDAVFEVDLETASIRWEWFAWDHGFGRSILGFEVSRDAAYIKKRRDAGAKIISDRAELLTAPASDGREPKIVAVLNPADWRNKAGFVYGLPAKFRPVHLNSARYGNAGRVLVTLFHQGEAIAIDPETNEATGILSGLQHPHGLMPLTGGRLLVTDTSSGRFFVMNGEPRPQRVISVSRMPGIVRTGAAPEWLQNTVPLENGILAAIDMHRAKLWLIDINTRRYRGIDLPQNWASQDLLPVPKGWGASSAGTFGHARLEIFPANGASDRQALASSLGQLEQGAGGALGRQALASSLGKEGAKRDPYGNLPGNFRKDGRKTVYDRLYAALAKKGLTHELSDFFANSFARQSDKALDRLVEWGFLKTEERALIESGTGKLDYPRLSSRIKRLHDTYLRHGFSPAQAKLMVFRFVPYPIAKELLKKFLSVKAVFVEVVKRHSDFPDFFARAAKAKESFSEETGLAETLLWQIILRQGLEASPETGGLPKAEWWIRQAKSVVDSFGEVQGLNASLKWQIAARQGIEPAAGMAKPKALEWFERAKQVVEAIPDAKGLNPTFKWEIVIGQGVEKAEETDGLPRARWWFDKTLSKVEHAIQLGTAPSTAWSRAIKHSAASLGQPEQGADGASDRQALASGLGTEQEPDAALVTWRDQYRQMLQTAGTPEQAQARYDVFYRQIREIFRQTFHRDDMLDDLVRAYVASKKPSLPIAVNPKIILQSVAVYLLMKSLSEPFWESDLAVVRDMIGDYNRLTDTIVPLSVPSLFKTALSPHYKDSELYVQLSRQLKRLPGDDGVWALALNLFATGAHLSLLSADRTDDFDHALEDAEFAVGLLKGDTLSSELREALEIGLGRFVHFLVPFEYGRVMKPKIHDPAGTLPGRVQGFIQRHAPFIAALVEEKDPKQRMTGQLSRSRTALLRDVGAEDYFLVGLDWFLYQRAEPIIFKGAPRSNVPIEKLFLIRSDPAAAAYLKDRLNYIFTGVVERQRSRYLINYDPMLSLIARTEIRKNLDQILAQAQSLGESKDEMPEGWGRRLLRLAREYRAAQQSVYYDSQLDRAERYLEAVNFFSGDQPAIRRLRQAMEEETMLIGHQEYIALAQNALDAAPDDKLSAGQKERKAVLVKRAEDYGALVAEALNRVRKSEGPSAQSLGQEPGPVKEEFLGDFQYDSSLGRDLRVAVVVKGTNQEERNLSFLQRRLGKSFDGSVTSRGPLHGLVRLASLDADQIGPTEDKSTLYLDDPNGFDVHGSKLLISSWNKLILHDYASGQTRVIHNNWFRHLHSVKFSPDGRRALVASSGMDMILEIDLETEQTTWEWSAWEHGYPVSYSGKVFYTRDPSYRGEETVEGRKVELIEDPAKFPDIGLPTGLRAANITGAHYDADGNILAAFLYRGKLIRINRETKQPQEVASLSFPHGFKQIDPNRFVATSTTGDSPRFAVFDNQFRLIREITPFGLPETREGFPRDRIMEWIQTVDPLGKNLYAMVDIHRRALFLIDTEKNRYRKITVPPSWAIQTVIPVDKKTALPAQNQFLSEIEMAARINAVVRQVETWDALAAPDREAILQAFDHMARLVQEAPVNVFTLVRAARNILTRLDQIAGMDRDSAQYQAIARLRQYFEKLRPVPPQRVLLLTLDDPYGTAILDKLADSPHQVVGVVTRRGGAPQVMKLAAERHIPVHFVPDNFGLPDVDRRMAQSPLFRYGVTSLVKKLKKLDPDIAVMAYFDKVPREIIEIPDKAFLNIHPSALPEFRGGHPLTAAILTGQRQMGITVHEANGEFDEGNIVNQRLGISIDPAEDAEDLWIKTAPMAADLIAESIDQAAFGEMPSKPQEGQPRYRAFAKSKIDGNIRLEDTHELDWSANTGAEIVRRVRAWNLPDRQAYTFAGGHRVHILSAEWLGTNTSAAQPGEILEVLPDQETPAVVVKTLDGAVRIRIEENHAWLRKHLLKPGKALGLAAQSLGSEQPGPAYVLTDVDFHLRDIIPADTRIEQVVILADNTGTLTINFETPLGEGMIQSLYGFLARPGGRTSAEKYSLVINSGDARQGVVSAHAPLIRRLADEPSAAPFLNDYYFTTDGGKYTFHLNESAGEVSLGQIPDWAVQDRVERSLAIAEAFYDEVAERMAHGPENLTPLLKGLTPEALARDRQLAEQTIRDKAVTEESWTSLPPGEVKNTVVCFLQEFFGKRVFVYDSGSKIAVESAQFSAKEQFPYDFYQALERRVRQKFGGDAAPFLTFTGTQFLDLTQVSKLEAVLGILHQRVFPVLDTTKPTLFVVIGDGGNDIPTLTHDFPEVPNSLRIPVFLSHNASFAGQLQGLWVSQAEKVAGGQEVVDWVNSIQGKLVKDTPPLKFKKWVEAQSLGQDEAAKAADKSKPVFGNISGIEVPVLYGDGAMLMPLAEEVGGGAVNPFALIGGIFTAGIGPDIKEYPVFFERVVTGGAANRSVANLEQTAQSLQDKSLDGAGVDAAQRRAASETPVVFQVMLKALKEGDRAGLRARLADLAPGSVVIGYDDRYAPSGLDLGGMLPAGVQYSRGVYEKALSLQRVKGDQARAAGKDARLAGHSVFLFSGFQDLVPESGDAEQDLKQIGMAFQLNAELLREQPRVLQSRIIPAIAGETLQFAKLDREAREQVLAQNRESGLLGFTDGAYAFELDLWMDARASQIISSAA